MTVNTATLEGPDLAPPCHMATRVLAEAQGLGSSDPGMLSGSRGPSDLWLLPWAELPVERDAPTLDLGGRDLL